MNRGGEYSDKVPAEEQKPVDAREGARPVKPEKDSRSIAKDAPPKGPPAAEPR